MTDPTRPTTLSLDEKRAWIAKFKHPNPYKAAFARLTVKLGRLPTVHDKEFWDLPGYERGVTS